MANRPPAVPPAGRSSKDPNIPARPARAPQTEHDRPPENLSEQDRQGNIRQNTTHQGYQQDR